MARAAMQILPGLRWDGVRAVFSFIVIVDNGHVVESSAPIDHSRSNQQVVNDMKSLARQVVTDTGGPALVDADITVYGGPS